ncbi:hypothetical protein D3874_06945 [Oleomonas cavernae]|uniref:Uncharacterized protein n=1 Tax=Oleomonas cavernae TaxID=2320859 RepID=A0A418W9T4_9PROT|nr:hypothetical protein [Oleomonas cavernae]RJF86787.1 hypothetical protein D3874_06945 [Oleomonas cavernae]
MTLPVTRADLLAALDELRRLVLALPVDGLPCGEPRDTEEGAAAIWIDARAAAERFDLPADTVRWLARNKSLGRRNRGRWEIDTAALRHYLSRRARRE